jgi:hypothetical protein
MPGRTWIIAPDRESLRRRWEALTSARPEEKEDLFHPHLRGGELGDKHVGKIVKKGRGRHAVRVMSVADDTGPCVEPAAYGFRSFDRQWIIPDVRLINQPNPGLWEAHSDRQVYLTAPMDRTPTAGPALTFSSSVPDLHHYHGRGGRVFTLWSDADTARPNVSPGLMALLGQRLGQATSAEDVLAYIAVIAAHPAYISRFREDLTQPGLRIPITTDGKLFDQAVTIGREIIWLHTFGERFADASPIAQAGVASNPCQWGDPRGPGALPR